MMPLCIVPIMPNLPLELEDVFLGKRTLDMFYYVYATNCKFIVEVTASSSYGDADFLKLQNEYYQLVKRWDSILRW